MTALFLSMFGIGKAVLTAVLTWLSKRSLAEIGCIVLGLACLVLFVAHRSEQRHAAKLETQLSKCTEGRKADRDAYAKAQSDAAAKNKAHVADVEAQQKRISDARLKDANDRLSRLAGELRARGPAAQGAANGAGSPTVPNPASGADAAPGLCLSPDQLLRAAQDEERHSQLIQWIEEQLKIDPNAK